ncbi:MAG: hypothetical protein KDA84_07460 [Planctomycetaceae bacterium]|nr:hypothetical protein [Planctomycetaceae bacterium]
MSIDAVAPETQKLLERRGLKQDRLGFYALRHTFQTVGERSEVTCLRSRRLWGHMDGSIAAVDR